MGEHFDRMMNTIEVLETVLAERLVQKFKHGLRMAVDEAIQSVEVSKQSERELELLRLVKEYEKDTVGKPMQNLKLKAVIRHIRTHYKPEDTDELLRRFHSQP